MREENHNDRQTKGTLNAWRDLEFYSGEEKKEEVKDTRRKKHDALIPAHKVERRQQSGPRGTGKIIAKNKQQLRSQNANSEYFE